MFFSLNRKLENLTLKRKLNMLFGLSVLVITIASLVGIQSITGVYKDHLNASIAEQLKSSGHHISNELQTIDHIGQLIVTDEYFQKEMSLIIKDDVSTEVKSAGKKRLHALLTHYSTTFSEKHITSLSLYDNSGPVTTTVSPMKELPSSVSSVVLEQTAMANEPTWVNTFIDSWGLLLGRQIHMENASSTEPIGYLIIQIDIRGMISDSSAFETSYNMSDYLLFDDRKLIYNASEKLTVEDIGRLHQATEEDYQVLTLNGHRYFVVSDSIAPYNLHSICLVSYDVMTAQIFHAHVLLISLMLAVTAVILFFVSRQITLITQHYDFLKKKMLFAAKNPRLKIQSPYDYSQSKDEIAILHTQFDQMLQQLNELIQENYVNELQLKEAQLQALQSQINPHFLYNTLESINWRARAAGANDISEMVQALASLLRVSLSRGRTYLTIRQELDLLDNYMKIQKFRFEDRLNCSISIPESLRNVQIPCLCIQPLAENAIQYGLEDNIDDCEIRIEGYEEQGQIHLIVRNTGSEFEEDLLQRIKDQTFTPKRHGIALNNIDERIRLTFGEQYGLHLYNRDDWAYAEIIIPFIKED